MAHKSCSPRKAQARRAALLLAQREKLMKADLWNDFPAYPRSDWRHQAAAGHTQIGYWDWVFHLIEQGTNGIG